MAAEAMESQGPGGGRARAAYACGVFALVPGLGIVLGPAAIVLGLLERRGNSPGLAWRGIALGALSTAAHAAGVVWAIV